MKPEIEEDIRQRTVTGYYGLATPPEWDEIIEWAHEQIKTINPNYSIYQIKEKFGRLRYYCSNDGNKEISKIIEEAERKVQEL